MELKRLRELRAEFGSFTALSKAIAKATGLTDVTLRRNRVYRALLLNYINVQSTRSSSNSRGDAELNKLRHKITELETQLSNASADNDRLRAYIEKMTEPAREIATLALSNPGMGTEASWEQDLLRTFQLVNALVSRAYFEINFANYTIEDSVGIDGDELVAGKHLAKPYVDWCKAEGGRYSG